MLQGVERKGDKELESSPVNLMNDQFVPVEGRSKEESHIPSDDYQDDTNVDVVEAQAKAEIETETDAVTEIEAGRMGSERGIGDIDKSLEGLVASEIKMHLEAFERVQRERHSSIEARINALEQRLSNFESKSEVQEGAVNKYEFEDVRLELSSLQREFRSKAFNILEPMDHSQDSSSGDNGVEIKNSMRARNKNPLYPELIEKNNHDAPTLSNLYMKTEQLGKKIKHQSGLNLNKAVMERNDDKKVANCIQIRCMHAYICARILQIS